MIRGRVLDTTGAMVPGAKVTAVNTATNVAISATSTPEGVYNLLFLIPGDYKVIASAIGFKTLERANIQLRIHDEIQLDLTLQVGDINERVEVTGEAPLLDAASANLGQVIASRPIAEMPIFWGAPLELMFLTPGVTNTYAAGMVRESGNNVNPQSQHANINGAPLGTTDFTIDGTPNTQTGNSDYGSGNASSPPSDMVQEFKLETPFDASVGHTSGTVANVTLKTGTNQLHGTAYTFLRDKEMNANSFFGNMNGQARGNFNYRRQGATVSGPIDIPKVYNGANRSFFSFGYEGYYDNEQQNYTYTVPDPKEFGGNFSNLLALGSQYQIYDPATIAPAANGRFSIKPFPGNIIPASRINPIALNILTYYPAPTSQGTADGTNNYSTSTRNYPERYYTTIGRFDHYISNKQRLYFRTGWRVDTTGPYRDYWDSIAVGELGIAKGIQPTIDDVYTFSPSLVMDVRYGYSRFECEHWPRLMGFDVSKLGFSPQVVQILAAVNKMFPTVVMSPYPTLAGEGSSYEPDDIHSFFLSFNKQAGSHNIKLGMDARVYRETLSTPTQTGGYFTFGSTYTLGPLDNSPSSPSGMGQSLASLLLGTIQSGSDTRQATYAVQSTYLAFYVHDTWRATSKLNLDIGLRWEYEGPETERYNQAVRGFDANAAQAIQAAAVAAYAKNPDVALPASQFHVRGGLLYAGVNGQPRGLWDPSYRNFDPRIGFAYHLAPKTVLRGGFGIYTISLGESAQNRPIQTGYTQATTLVPTLDNGQHFIADLNNPFPSGVLAPPGNSLGLATYLGNTISFFNPVAKTPYTMQWAMNVQRTLPGQVLLEVGYRGNKSLKLRAAHNIDALPDQYLSTSPTRDNTTINYLSANVTNPFAGLLPGTTLNGAAISRYELLEAYPQFQSVSMTDSQGYEWYHAFQIRLERRFSRGFTVMEAFSYSKWMQAIEYLNAGDPTPYRDIAPNDIPKHLTLSGIYELPFGKGKWLGRSAGRLTNRLIGGWQLSPIWHIYSGLPIAWGNIFFNGNIKDIPLPTDQRSLQRWFNTDAGFVKSSALQPSYNLRTFPLRLSGVRADYFNLLNLEVDKNFQIYERLRFQFRVESLNVLNHPTDFTAPNATPTNSAFGQVTGTNSVPRYVQIGLKGIF